MSRPTTRVLAVLELLQSHHRISGAELARRLGVDRRTVRRYIVALDELGIPVSAERGRDGAYMLAAGFKLPPMMFTDDEALALSIGLLAARGMGFAGAAPAAANARAKLERVMPPAVKRKVRAVADTVTLDLSPPIPPDDNAALLTLAAAADDNTRVHLRYRSVRGVETTRDFDPYGLAYRGGRWYVVGRCHLRNGLRSFRLDRVKDVRPLDRTFDRPDDFDALEHLTFSVATLPRAHAVDLVLKTDLATARREVFSALGVLHPVPEGVRLRSQADDLHWFARELARLPFAFVVEGPAALRAAVAAHARALLERCEPAAPVPRAVGVVGATRR